MPEDGFCHIHSSIAQSRDGYRFGWWISYYDPTFPELHVDRHWQKADDWQNNVVINVDANRH